MSFVARTKNSTLYWILDSSDCYSNRKTENPNQSVQFAFRVNRICIVFIRGRIMARPSPYRWFIENIRNHKKANAQEHASIGENVLSAYKASRRVDGLV